VDFDELRVFHGVFDAFVAEQLFHEEDVAGVMVDHGGAPMAERDERDVLESGVLARTGVSYQFLNPLLSRGLLEVVNITKKGRRLRTTEKGRFFLEHYKICERIFPPF